MIPFALFNSKALFNPYQYKPFFSIMLKEEAKEQYRWNNENIFITDEVGVGKTIEAGIILQEMIKNNRQLSVLIICPVKLCDNWEKELREMFFLSFNNYRAYKQLGQFNIVPYSYFIENKSNQKESDTAIEENLIKARDELSDGLLKKIEQLEYDILILDEAHYIRNEGKLKKSISKLIDKNESVIDKKLKIFMTATPVFNSEKDYEHIVSLLQKNGQFFKTTTTLQGESNCYDFILNIANRETELDELEREIIDDIYAIKEDEDGVEKTKYGHITGFLKRISASSIYSLKMFVNKKASFDDGMSESYDESLEELLNLCEPWSKKEDTKLKDLIKLLKEIELECKKSFQVIIFSTFLDTCYYLESRLKEDYNVFTITGKDNPKKVLQAKINFEKNKRAILICSDAAKEGHNLQFCNYLIHYDFPFTPAAMGQRNGRIYRKGQEESPRVFYMSVKESYDQRLFGEIIVDKSYIVKTMSDEGKVSILNVLPTDSAEYIKECLRSYFKDLVAERKRNWKSDKNNKDKAEPSLKEFERKEFKLQILKNFLSYTAPKKEDGKKEVLRTWQNNELKELYEQKEEIDYSEKFVEIFTSNKEDAESLQKYYKEQYEKQENMVVSQIFGKGANFKEECNKQVEPYITINTTKKSLFCQDMLNSAPLSIGEYKEQFIPLIELQGEEHGE